MSFVKKKVVLLHPQNDASVAQLVEHLTLNQGVQGSTPCPCNIGCEGFVFFIAAAVSTACQPLVDD